MKKAALKVHSARQWSLLTLCSFCAFLSLPALAHHPMGGAAPSTLWQGLLSGLAHPVIELDHLLFLLGMAIATSVAGTSLRRAVAWLLTFSAASALGTVIRVSGIVIPHAEFALAVSLLLAGVWLWQLRLPVLVLAALWLTGGIVHGYAYGEAVIGSETTPLFAYLCGLVLVQAVMMASVYLAVKRVATTAREHLRPLARAAALFVSITAVSMLWAAA